MNKSINKSLGRGLSNILQSDDDFRSPEHNVVLVNIEDIIYNPDNPRKYVNEEYISNLATTILEHGLLHPILVRKKESKFVIISGERRVRAFKKNNQEKVPCIIKDINEQENLEISLIENIQREQIGAIEEANVYKILIDQYSFTQEKLSKRVGKSRTAITNKLRLLHLPKEMQEDLSLGILTEGQLRPLLSIKEAGLQTKLYLRIKEEAWSARKIEAYIKDYQSKSETSNSFSTRKLNAPTDVNIQLLEKELAEKYHRNVKINYSSKTKKGKIIFDFYKLDDFDRLFNEFK